MMSFAAQHVRTLVRDFAEDETGVVAAEAVITLPILAWAYAATFVWFDAFKSETQYMKAAYALADAISREMAPITPTYIDSVEKMLNFMTDSAERVQVRVSIVCWSVDDEEYRVAWSQTRGGADALSNANVNNYSAHLPSMTQYEELIFLETWTVWEPAFNMGLEARTMYNPIVTKPRFAAQVIWNDDDQATCANAV